MHGKGIHECERLGNLLERAQGKLRTRENDLARADEAVRIAQGEIAFAENALQRIVDQITSTAQSAVACAVGDRRDCVAVAVGLANEQARQQAKIGDLNVVLHDRISHRDRLRIDVDLDQNDVARILSAMNANGC